MAHIIYRREDFFVNLRRTAEGGATVAVGAASLTLAQSEFSAQAVRAWIGSRLDDAADGGLEGLIGLVDLLLPAIAAGLSTQAQHSIFRVVLRIDDCGLSSLPWEWFLKRCLPCGESTLVIVRAAPVRFPIASIPLTLPLRILEAGKWEDSELEKIILPLFGSQDPNRVARAIRFDKPSRIETLIDYQLDDRQLSPQELIGKQRCPLDILHLWQPQFPDDIDDVALASQPGRPGTLGWAMRLIHQLRLRLLVLMIGINADDEAKALRLGAAVTARGGSAVLVLPGSTGGGWLQGFYDDLVHNFPLDEAVRRNSNGSFLPALFVGGGREEGLRITRLGEELKSLAEQLSMPQMPYHAFKAVTDKLGEALGVHSELRENLLSHYYWQGHPINANQTNVLQAFVEAWPTLEFEHHESQGLLPLADHVRELYHVIFAHQEQQQQQQRQQQQQEQQQVQERFVNSSLWDEQDGEQWVRLEQSSVRLSLDKLYHLEIFIGPQDVRVKTIGAAALDEHLFEWKPETTGAWLEIALTGLDCEIWGDPVRDVWLPQAGASDPVYFAIRPTVAPVSRLRFCVYYQQNIIQSFRLALATTDPSAGAEPDRPTRCALLAQALGVPEASVPDVGFLPRLEYSLGGSAPQWTSRPPRTLSIVANDLDGKAVITVKGAETFGVGEPGDISDDVDAVRESLRIIGTRKFDNGDESYRFGLDGDPNRGKPNDLQEALLALAQTGRDLYVKLFPNVNIQAKIEKSLAEPGVIHVAHILVEKVLPWAALYGHHYDANKDEDAEGRPVAHAACTAAIAGPVADALKLKCGDDPDCLLHRERLKERAAAGQPTLLPETVACPLRFWGFRHIIELPAQQAEPAGEAPADQQDWIDIDKEVNVVVGLHSGLRLAEEHAKDIAKIAAPPLASLREEWSRSAVMELLDDPQIDVAYLYCHARGGEVKGVKMKESLELQARNNPKPGVIWPGDFGPVEWTHHPMVIINGCHTAGFSPAALSPFVRVFMGRKSSGVIGTEIDVWEELAGEFAELFLREFLSGVPAGEALRRVRLSLLAKNNPLGLVYTLYAASQLSLRKPEKHG